MDVFNECKHIRRCTFLCSFACSWAFAELKKMEGNAKIIKLIARDENVHLASTQQMLKLLPREDKDFAKIEKETYDDCTQLFLDAVEQEKKYHYLFKDGSIIGLNAELLKQYVEYIAGKRITQDKRKFLILAQIHYIGLKHGLQVAKYKWSHKKLKLVVMLLVEQNKM